MRLAVEIPVLAILAISLLCGCVTRSASDLESGKADRVYFSAEQPASALFRLAEAAKRSVATPSVVDPAAGRMVIATLHPVYNTGMSLLVVRVDNTADQGSFIRMWVDGVQPIVGGNWADRLWESYVAEVGPLGIAHRAETRDASLHIADSRPTATADLSRLPDMLLLDVVVIQRAIDDGSTDQSAKVAELTAELRRRPLISPEEWGAIDRRAVFVGMSKAAVRVSYGDPAPHAKKELLTGAGKTELWKYGATAIYIHNDTVVAVEN